MESSTILYCRDRLEEQLQKAKESLKGVDSNLKRFVSRTVSDQPPRNTFNKTPIPLSDRWKTNREDSSFNNSRRRPAKVLGDDIENIPVKRRLGPKVLHSSLSGPPRRDDFDDGPSKKPTVSSCVIAKPQILPPRKEAVAVKTYTETRARDRRMFGSLIGTLQKFRQEETQLKDKEDKKAQVEKKLEDAARREKENLRRERQKLMDFKKQRESFIKACENNMKLVKEQEQWEELHKPLFNYIQTETKPPIYYLPKVHTEKTLELLESGKVKLTKLIEEKRQSVKEEVDSLISQWKNVNVDEFSGKDSEQSSRSMEERNNDDQVTEDTPWDMDSSNKTNQFIANGSNTKPSSHTYSAKERRIKRNDLSVKEEREDDDEYRIAIKQEKNVETADADDEQTENMEKDTADENMQDEDDDDDADHADQSPREKEDGNVSES